MGLLNTCAKCGCEDNFLTTPPPCPTAIACPTEECSAVQYAKCIAYTGSDIECNNDIVVPTDTNMAAAINNIVDYFCTVTTVPAAILCDTDVVVAANTVIVEALADTISYFCSATTVPAILDCNSATVVAANTPVVTALGNIVDYFCSVTTTSANIVCGTDVVVTSGTPVLGALVSMTNYFCTEIANLPTVSIIGDNGILVTSNVVGTNTEYTISANGLKKFVKEFTGIEFDSQVITILGTELTACGLLSSACGVSTTKASDFTFNIMYLFAGNWISITNQAGVVVQANDITGNISITLGLAAIDPPVTVRVTIVG